MDDLNFLHQSYQAESGSKESGEYDELEGFGLKPKIIIVEDDTVLGISIKKYLMKTLNCEIELFTNSMDCLNHVLNMPNQKSPFCLITDISL